jgi:hypothetical protein
MKRNIIHVFALASTIFAGGVAFADSGYRTGHHELRAQRGETNSGVMTKGSVGGNGVQHLSRHSDGTLMPKKGYDVHPQSQNVTRRDTGARSPLPLNAGNDR